MRRSGIGSGGGLGMNKNVSPSYRTGVGGRAVRPSGAGAIGAAWGRHISERRNEADYAGEKVFAGPAMNPTRYGNEIAASTKPGPGGSREVF